MTVRDRLIGLFNDVLQGRQRCSSFAVFRLRTLAKKRQNLSLALSVPVKRIVKT